MKLQLDVGIESLKRFEGGISVILDVMQIVQYDPKVEGVETTRTISTIVSTMMACTSDDHIKPRVPASDLRPLADKIANTLGMRRDTAHGFLQRFATGEP